MPRKNLKGYIFSETIVGWILCCCSGIVSDFSVFCSTSFGERNICNTKTNTNLSLSKHTISSKKNHNVLFCFQKVLRAFLEQQPYSNNANTGTSVIKNWSGKNYVPIL